jgi:hypothetical protein
MHRLTAKLLLLFALAGSFAPLAMASSAPRLHACCIRKAAHHCEEAASSEPLSIRSAGCCSGDCSRALTTLQWAHPRPHVSHAFRQNALDGVMLLPKIFANIEVAEFYSTRAPPHFSIA